MKTLTVWQRLLNWIAPAGYEDESGFHYGPERGSLNNPIVAGGVTHTNWVSVTNFSSLSNSITTGSNLQFTVRVPVWYGAQFWTATADDSFWGKSFFAQNAWTNPLPRIDQHITITR